MGTHIPSLDGLRAVSIALVLVDHVSRTPGFPIAIQADAAERWLEAVGALGVRVFFVISGFLITSLLIGELQDRGRIHLGRFYVRRTLRIFVPYYTFVAAMVVLQPSGLVSVSAGDVAHAITYTVNYFPERTWDLGHGWSLSVEEQFYLVWPALLLLLGVPRALWIPAVCVALAPLTRLTYSYMFPSLVQEEVGYRFETVADALAIGCLLAGTATWLDRQSLYHRMLHSRLLGLVSLLAVACGMYGASLYPHTRAQLLFGTTLQNVGIVACIAWCIGNPGSAVGKVLNSRLLVLPGLMSYSIYLWQQPFTNPFSGGIVSQFPLNIALLIAASVASYRFVERPAIVWRQTVETRLFGPIQRHAARRSAGILRTP